MDKDAQRNPESVRRFWGRVATGDWDAVIVPESRFSQLHVSKERRLRNMRARVDEFAQAVEAAAQARGDKDPTVKRLEAARKSAETAMQRLRDGKESRDDKALAGIEFESLGVDMLIVDEAHHFRTSACPSHPPTWACNCRPPRNARTCSTNANGCARPGTEATSHS